MFLLKTDTDYIYSLVENKFPDNYNVTWECKVMIRDKSTFNLPPKSFILLGTTENIQNDDLFQKCNTKTYFMELLKSNLQKCIRRGLAESAVKTAYQIINQDMETFLRRIINIIAEDSVIHPKMLEIMWLYIAHSKGYKISNMQVSQLLEIVYQVSNFNYHDIIITDPNYAKPQDCSFDYIIDSIDDTVTKVDQCCFSMLLRSIYGGMKNDMIFLRSSSKIWKNRMENNKDEWIKFISDIWTSNIEFNHSKIVDNQIIFNNKIINLEFSDADKHDFAVDQHCFGDKFCEKIKFYTKTNYTIPQIKEAIWYWRSSYTNKMLMSDYNNYNSILICENPKRENGMLKSGKVWEEISECVKKISHLYWK